MTAFCPGLPGSASTRKVKPVWVLLKQETVSGSGISWTICKSAPRSRQITTQAPHHSVLQAGCPSCRPTNSVKPRKASTLRGKINSKVIERPGVHAFHRVWNQFPASLRQPRTNLPDSNPPVPVTATTSSIDSPRSSSITPSLFHSSHKTSLFCNSFLL